MQSVPISLCCSGLFVSEKMRWPEQNGSNMLLPHTLLVLAVFTMCLLTPVLGIVQPLNLALKCIESADSPLRVVLLLIPRTASRHLATIFRKEYFTDSAAYAGVPPYSMGLGCYPLTSLHTKPMTQQRLMMGYQQYQGSRLSEELVQRIRRAVVEIYETHLKTETHTLSEMFQRRHGGKEFEFYLSVCNRFAVTPDPELVAAAEQRLPSDTLALAQNLQTELMFRSVVHAARQRKVPLVTVCRDPVDYLLSHYGVMLRDDRLPVPTDWQSEFYKFVKQTRNINAQLSFLVGKRYLQIGETYESAEARVSHFQSANETDFYFVQKLLEAKSLHALTTDRFEAGVRRVAAELRFSSFDVHNHPSSDKSNYLNKHESRKLISIELLPATMLADIRLINSLDVRLHKLVSRYDLNHKDDL